MRVFIFIFLFPILYGVGAQVFFDVSYTDLIYWVVGLPILIGSGLCNVFFENESTGE